MPAPSTTIYAAAASLDKYTSMLRGLRSGLAAMRLPIPAAEDSLDHVDDLLATVETLLDRAAKPINDNIEATRQADEAGRARQDRAVEADFKRWDRLVRPAIAPANDDASLARLVASLRSGVV